MVVRILIIRADALENIVLKREFEGGHLRGRYWNNFFTIEWEQFDREQM